MPKTTVHSRVEFAYEHFLFMGSTLNECAYRGSTMILEWKQGTAQVRQLHLGGAIVSRGEQWHRLTLTTEFGCDLCSKHKQRYDHHARLKRRQRLRTHLISGECVILRLENNGVCQPDYASLRDDGPPAALRLGASGVPDSPDARCLCEVTPAPCDPTAAPELTVPVSAPPVRLAVGPPRFNQSPACII